jgi:hypothetical protein
VRLREGLLDCPQTERNVRALTATWLCGLLVIRTASAASTTDTQFANYAFASELGSGIYEINDRTVTVYQLQPGYQLRPAAPRGGRPGIKIIVPITVGFFNFQTSDLVHLQIPTSIGALSLEPGVELDYWIDDDWDIYPYVKGGGTFASSAAINAIIYDLGVRSDYRFDLLSGAALWRADLTYAGVHYTSDLPNDSFTRLRDAVEVRRNLPWVARGHAVQIGPYAIADVYLNAPTGPASGISARTLQFEAGLMLDVSPRWEVRGWPLPRIGIGYREAGILSGWRLVIGDPF